MSARMTGGNEDVINFFVKTVMAKKTNYALTKGALFLLCALFSLTVSADGKWLKLTQSPNKEIPSQNVKNTTDEDAELEQWLNSTYNTVLNNLDYMQAMMSMDYSKYYSSDLNRVLKACDKACRITGDVYGWETNHWVMAQDWDNPRMYIDEITSDDGNHATAQIHIDDNGNRQNVELKMVKENGSWKIDDFVQIADGQKYSEKKEIISELKSSNLGRLLNGSSKTPRSYNDLVNIAKLGNQFQTYGSRGYNGLKALTQFLTANGYHKGNTLVSGGGYISAIFFTRNCTANRDGEIVRFSKGNSSLISIGRESGSSGNLYCNYLVYNKGAVTHLREQLINNGYTDMGIDSFGEYTFKKGDVTVTYVEFGKEYRFCFSF